MKRHELEEAFHAMLSILADVPNVTPAMMAFDGSAHDIELFGYFFYEGVLPCRFSDTRKAALFILAQALCNDLGFDWIEDSLLANKELGLTVNLDEVKSDESKGVETDYGAIEDYFDSVRLAIARRGHLIDRRK